MPTTIVYLFPPGPRTDPVFRVTLGGREINRWRFQVVRLWKIQATAALARGSAGLVEPMSEAESVLPYLAGRHYTFEEMARLIGRELCVKMVVRPSRGL